MNYFVGLLQDGGRVQHVDMHIYILSTNAMVVVCNVSVPDEMVSLLGCLL